MIKKLTLFACISLVTWVAIWEPEEKISKKAWLTAKEKSALLGIDEIAVIQQDNTLVLTKKNDVWMLEKNAYPAHASKIHAYLNRLQKANVKAKKTQNSQWYSKLGVQPVSEGGTQVKLMQAGQTIFQYLVGLPYHLGQDATYVRRVKDKPSYLVDQDLQWSLQPVDWVNRQIIALRDKEIHQIQVEHVQEPFTLSQDNPGDVLFRILSLPKNKKIKGETEHLKLLFAFHDLNFDDVAKDKPASAKKVNTIRIILFTGQVITVSIYKAENSYWLKTGATQDMTRRHPQVEIDEAKLTKSIQQYNENKSTWFYRVSQRTGEQLSYGLSAYIE